MLAEGVAVALPVYFATGSRWKGFAYAFVSGLAEPAAVIILGVVFRAFWVNKVVIDCLLAAVSEHSACALVYGITVHTGNVDKCQKSWALSLSSVSGVLHLVCLGHVTVDACCYP